MWTNEMLESIRKVEATRAQRMAQEPRRMSAEEKDTLLRQFHPDYRSEGFDTIAIGPNAGQKAPKELVQLLHSNSRLLNEHIDLNKIDIDTDVLVIGGGGAGSSAAIEAHNAGAKVDEAYQLVDGSLAESYGQEAIDTLVKIMEDHRNELILIVAGYPEDMKKFLRANAGLESRFKRTIEFPDYSPEEMMQILEHFLEGWILSEETRAYILENLSEETKKRGFANGRSVRKIAGKLKQSVDERIGRMMSAGSLEIRKELLQTITMEDAARAFEEEKDSARIGFCGGVM